MSTPLPAAERFVPGRCAVPACPCGCGADLFVVRVPGVESYWLCDGCGWIEGDAVVDAAEAQAELDWGWPVTAAAVGAQRLAETPR